MHDSLRRNSSFILASQSVYAVLSFVFWLICAHLFRPVDVGLATSFIAFCVIAATFTNLGLPNTIVRFLPTSRRQGGLFTGALCLVLGFAIAGGAIALVLITAVVPKLAFVRASLYLEVLFVTLIVVTSLGAFLDGTLISFRRGDAILVKSLLVNSTRLLLILVISMYAFKGMLTAFVVALCFGVIYSLTIVVVRLLRSESLRPTVLELREHRLFAASNYVGGIFGIVPSTVVLLIVLDRLGAKSEAYFYLPMQIAAFLGIIASSASQAMIAEAAQREDEQMHAEHFRNAFRQVFVVLVPAVVATALLGWPILSLYGGSYASQGFVPLVILAAASLLVAINWLGDTWLNVKKRSVAYFLMNTFNAVLVVGLVYLLSPGGLVMAALGWLAGQGISALVYLAIFARGQILASVRSRTPLG